MALTSNSFFLMCSWKPEEAATRANHVHPDAIRRARNVVRQNPIPGHIHARRGGPEDQPARVQSAGNSIVYTFVLQDKFVVRTMYDYGRSEEGRSYIKK